MDTTDLCNDIWAYHRLLGDMRVLLGGLPSDNFFIEDRIELKEIQKDVARTARDLAQAQSENPEQTVVSLLTQTLPQLTKTAVRVALFLTRPRAAKGKENGIYENYAASFDLYGARLQEACKAEVRAIRAAAYVSAPVSSGGLSSALFQLRQDIEPWRVDLSKQADLLGKTKHGAPLAALLSLTHARFKEIGAYLSEVEQGGRVGFCLGAAWSACAEASQEVDRFTEEQSDYLKRQRALMGTGQGKASEEANLAIKAHTRLVRDLDNFGSALHALYRGQVCAIERQATSPVVKVG